MFDFFPHFAKDLKAQTIFLVFFLLATGITSSLLAYFHFYSLFLSLLLIFPLLILLLVMYTTFVNFNKLNVHQQTLIVFLLIVWLSHLVQVFVPETGFDALWYHLPVIKSVVESQGLYFDPNFYQTLNPLFSDLIFGLGYFAFNDLGTKIVAYLFGVSLVLVSYQLARKFVGKTSALLFVFLISTFQVISWQSASFYVDIAKAFWEIACIWMMIEFIDKKKENYYYLILAGLLFSASLATKMFSIILLPIFLFILAINKKYAASFIFLLISFVLPMIFYLFSFEQTKDPFYVLNHINTNIWEIVGYDNMFSYLRERTINLFISPIILLLSADYISSGVIILLPLLILYFKYVKSNIKIISLLIFSIGQWLVWWYLPPLSTRYALSGFITLSLAVVYLIGKIKKNNYRKIIIALLIVSIWVNLLPRFYVNLRSFRYILGFETKQQYLQHFYDGWADGVIKKWHDIE